MKGHKVFRRNGRILGIFFRNAPLYSALSLLGGALSAVCQVVSNTLLVQFLYDALQAGAGFTGIGWALGGVLGLLTLKGGLNCFVEECMAPKAINRVRRGMQTQLFERAQSVGLMAYDDPEYYDRLVFAMEQADGRAVEIFSDLRRMVEMGVCYLGLLGVIFTLDAGAFLPALGCFAVSYISGRRRADMEFKREQQGLFPRRAMGYFPECMIRRGCAQEMRMSGMGTVLNEGHDQAARTLQGVNGRWGGKLFRTAVLGTLLGDGLFLDFGLYGYLAYLFLSGGLDSVGAMMGLAFAAENTIWRTEELIRLVPRFSGHALFVAQYEEFLGLER